MDPFQKNISALVEKIKSNPNQIHRAWEILSSVPGGKWTFSKILGIMAPYTGTVSARVRHLKPGYAEVEINDHKAIRNHLDSIHAIALVNLSEIASNLALLAGLPTNAQIIIKKISTSYHKKARGKIIAEGDAPVLDSAEKREVTVEATLMDEEGDVTTTAELETLVGPA